jgi:predicted ester cyclase
MPRLSLNLATLMLVGALGAPLPSSANDDALVKPAVVTLDGSLLKDLAETEMLAARRYDTFWSTGDDVLAKTALDPNFIDRTLPPGREQGLAGPLAASKFVRAAIPDLTCEISQMVVAGDRVVTHLRFKGHFTGMWKQVKGQGQAIDFIATDIYRIANGRIVENWHLEDNLTLLQQLGLAGQ